MSVNSSFNDMISICVTQCGSIIRITAARTEIPSTWQGLMSQGDMGCQGLDSNADERTGAGGHGACCRGAEKDGRCECVEGYGEAMRLRWQDFPGALHVN